jgi:hypothetical protein
MDGFRGIYSLSSSEILHKWSTENPNKFILKVIRMHNKEYNAKLYRIWMNLTSRSKMDGFHGI